MRDWLTRQRQQLHGFYRDGFGHTLAMTAVAFGILVVLSYVFCLFKPDAVEWLVELFAQQIADRGIVDAEGNFSPLALLGNNLQATTIAMAYGFIPFLYLPALSLGINALVFGGFASFYVQRGLPLWYYAAGTLPHGIFELPALFLGMAGGLYLCRAITRYVRQNEKGIVGPLVKNLVRLLVMHVLPLLAAAAVVEAYVTPALLRRLAEFI